MGGPSNHPVVDDLNSWMRQQEKRTLHEERRPRVTRAADLMGPGLAAHAVEINDWSGEETRFNGYFFTRPGALHSPDTTKWWMGHSIAEAAGFGIQMVWDYRGTTVPIVTMTRRFSMAGGTRVFSTWA